jgi:hypothetical protein
MVMPRPWPADDRSVWWLWVVGGLVAWTLVAFLLAVILGRGIRLADVSSPDTGESAPLTTVALDGATTRTAPLRTRRRSVPLPPIGIALAAVAVTLMTVGYVARLTGARGATAQVLSMDAPFSIPRLFVAALFAAAALAAVTGAGVLPGRRTWWLAVGLVGGGIAAVKAGSTVHASALNSLADAVGGAVALALSAALAGAVVAALWFLSRAERRDRRRVLGVLGLYAVASVGLSAVSQVAGGLGAQWGTTATYLEESGEALAAVAFLMAVLVGVAPRLVLPADWALRRELDAQTLDLPEAASGRTSAPHGAR